MSVNKLGIILCSGFLALATAPFAPAQSTTTQDTTTKKQTTTQKGTTTNDQSTKSDQSTSTKSTSKTAKSKSQTTDNTADKDNQSTTSAKKTKKGTTDKKSSMSHEKVRQTQVALKNQGFAPWSGRRRHGSHDDDGNPELSIAQSSAGHRNAEF